MQRARPTPLPTKIEPPASRPVVKVPERQGILLDANPESGKILSHAITTMGHEMRLVTKLRPVLTAIRAREVNWIICDLDVLSQDKLSAGFLRSALILSPEVRFMAIASDKNLEGILEAIRRGAHEVLYRPFPEPTQLRVLLKSFFDPAKKH
jgi:DNA-binding NtrC family response regulator